MKEKRKKDIILMADAVDDRHKFHTNPEKSYQQSYVSPDIMMRKIKKAEDIIATKKLEIPKCYSTPINGRIYVISVASSELRSPGGLILPQLYAPKKDDSLQDIKRYFVVAWDKDEIPESIQKKLCVGIEINPFLPSEAQNWSLPRVIDWQSNQIFEILHYTELAGISSVTPEIVEK